MAKYYATISGLPNIGVDDRKIPFSSDFFFEDLKHELTTADKKLFLEIRWEEENHFLIDFLVDSEAAREAEEQPTLFSYDELELVLVALKKKERLPKNSLPPYFIPFLKEFIVEREEDEEPLSEEEMRIWPTRLEDKLTDFYFSYVLKSKNDFVSDWSRFNLDIRNVFATFTSRKLGWDPKEYIVGNTEIEQKLRASSLPHLGVSEDDISYINTLVSIQNESDITRRERMIDVLKWNWLEEKTFDLVFDIESLLAYYLRLRIIERWTELNEKTGEETFRSIVATLKKESNTSLNEFKKNQKK